MAYNPTNWENFPSTNTPLNANNLNKIENQLAKLSSAIRINTTGTNLNDYREDGIYYFDAGYTPTNIPAGVNGWLQVMTGENAGGIFVKQIWYRHGTPDSNDYETYVRTFSVNTWSKWTKLLTEKNQIQYNRWHSIVLTRSDDNYIYVMLYGSNQLREGNYSIADDFELLTYGQTSSNLTIPKSAINNITRHDWGFELTLDRSGISGISSSSYNGIAVVANPITLQST